MIVFIGYTHVYKLLLFLLKHLNYDFNMLQEMDPFLPRLFYDYNYCWLYLSCLYCMLHVNEMYQNMIRSVLLKIDKCITKN